MGTISEIYHVSCEWVKNREAEVHMHAIIEGHADQRAQIKEEERVTTRNAGKLKGLFDYLTEPMKSKPQRGENVGEYRKEIFWRRSHQPFQNR